MEGNGEWSIISRAFSGWKRPWAYIRTLCQPYFHRRNSTFCVYNILPGHVGLSFPTLGPYRYYLLINAWNRTTALFTDDPFITAAREQPFWIATGLSTVAYGYASTKLRDIRIPLFVGFLLFTSGIIGLATIQPHQSTSILCFAGLAGIGFGGPLVLIIAGVQLSVPHHLIATATALTTSSRAISATVFTAIFVAALNTRLTNYIPHYVAKAAIIDKLPLKSVPGFVEALAGDNTTALLKVPGVTPKIIEDGVAALLHALADGIRVVFIIAAPFGIVACLICFFLGDLRGVMNYRVDAPVEKLHAKHHRGENA